MRVVGKLYISNPDKKLYRFYAIFEVFPFFLILFFSIFYFVSKIQYFVKKRKLEIEKNKQISNITFCFINILVILLITFCLLLSIIFHISGKYKN